MTDPLTGREPALSTPDDVTGREPFIGGEASIAQALLQLGDADIASTDVLVARLAGALPQLAALLHDEDERKRSQAARLIGMVAAGHPSSREQSIPLLGDILNEALAHNHRWLVFMAIESLSGTSDPLAAETLSKFLAARSAYDAVYWNYAIRGLTRLGATSLPTLMRNIGQDSWVDDWLIEAVTRICRANPQTVPQLIEWITPLILNRQISLSYGVNQLLQRLRPPFLAERLIEIAVDIDEDIAYRGRVINTLSYIPDARISPILIRLLTGDELPLRRYAMIGLRRMRTQEDIRKIVELIGHSDVQIRRHAIMIAGGRKLKAAIPAIIDALSDGQAATRQQAVIALRRIQESSTVPVLCGMIQDRAKPVRYKVVEVLFDWRTRFPEHREAIDQAFQKAAVDTDAEIRNIAEFVLRHQ
jgi:HEAT repeat protein